MKTTKIVLAVCLLFLLAGCGPAATPTPIPTTATQPTPAGTAVQPSPTLTPVPPTATQVPPTRTPLPPTSTLAPLTGSSGGLIAFVSTRDGNGEIYVMNADGSSPRRLTDHRLWDGFPDWSPDGTQIAYYSYLSSKNWVIKVMDADGGNPHQLTAGGACDGAPHWSPDGTQITYDSGDCDGGHREIYAISVDGGTPVNLSNNPADDMLAAWSPDGTRLVFSSDRDGNYEIYTMDADGSNVQRLTDNPAEDHAPAWSPDGSRIAFYSNRDGNEEIYVMDADGSNPGNVTNDPAADWFPSWSPDGSQLTFSSWRDGNLEIYAMHADGSDVRRLTNSPGEDFNSVWQPAPVSRSPITWSRSYQDEILGTVLDGTPTSDGGYLFVGSTHFTHNNRDDEDLYLLKTDVAGEPLWEKTLGGDRFDRGIDILPWAGGGFVVLGETRSFGAGDRDIYLLMIDDQGEQLWSRTFGGPKEEQALAIQPTADGGYALSGQTASFGAGGTDLYLVKTDAQGNEEWSRTFGSELDEEGCDVAELPEGGFLVQGVLLHKGQDYLAMNPDLYLVRTDGQGNVLWSRVLEEPGVQAGFHMLPTPDGHYLITGLRSDTGTDVGIDPLVVQIDVDGNVLWDRAIGEPNSMDYASAVLATPDGGYLVTGLSQRDGRGGIPLTRLDENGQALWREMLSEDRGNRSGIAILEAVGGGYLVIGTVSDGGPGWYTLLIKTDPGNSEGGPGASSSDEEQILPLRAFVDDLAASDQFSGAVLIALAGKPIWQEAYGMADRTRGIPNRIDTKFNLGSMNKMFTAVAIMQLVEQGRLSVDAKIADVLPEYPNRQVAEAVTIHQLLTHTAGMGDCFAGEFFTTPKDQLKTVAGYLPLFVDKPLQFEPGTAYAYSNEGYIVLGLVIEKITGQSYFDYVRQNIYEPAGMVNTDAFELDTAVPNLAIGYTTQDAEGNQVGTLMDNTPLMPVKGTPAGGGYASAEDLLHFAVALLGNRLLRPESTELLLRGKIEIREGIQYAYGFMDKTLSGHRVVGHGGNAPGVCNLMDLYLDLGYIVIVLSNTDTGCLAVREFLQENPLP